MKKLIISAAGLIFCFSAISLSQTPLKEERIGNILFRNHKINSGMQMLQKEADLFSEDTLPKLKEDFIVNNTAGDFGADQMNVYGAADSSGSSGFVWIDYRDGVKNIYAQFYDGSKQKVGTNFKVNTSSLSGTNSLFIASNKKGDYVAVWLIDFSYIMAQRFTKDGQRIGENILVNSTWGMNIIESSAAVSEDGSFMIVWASEQGNGIYQVYAKLFDANGNALTSEIYVSEYSNTISSIGENKNIAVDGKGNYFITWSSIGNYSSSQIFAQKINFLGEKIGANILVSSPNDSTDNYFPEIASTNDGHFLIAWNNRNKTFSRNAIKGRLYFLDHFINDEIIISAHDNWSSQFCISSDRESTFFIINSGIYPSYFQKINKSGTSISNPVNLILDPNITIYAFEYSITDVYKNSFTLSFISYQKNDPNVLIRRYNSDLSPEGDFVKINDDFGSSFQQKPLVHFNDQGSSIVLWQDRRNGSDDLYAQVYDKDFNPIGENIQVNDSHPGNWSLNDKDVEHLSDGSFVAAFSAYDDSLGYCVYLQHISLTGEKSGSSVIVKKQYYSSTVNLKINKQDQILLCWYDSYAAYLRKFSSRLIPLNEEKSFIEDISRKEHFSLSIDREFNIFTAWYKYNVETKNDDYKLYGLFYDEKGNQSGSSLTIADDISYNYLALLCISNDKKDFIVLWADYYKIYIKRIYSLDFAAFLNLLDIYGYSYSLKPEIINFENRKAFIKMNNGLSVYGYFLNDNKQKIDSYILHTYSILNEDYGSYNSASNSVDIIENKLAFAYENNLLQSTGLDIWMNVQEADKINFNKEGFVHPANYDFVYTNYPNPFNSRTKILYHIFAFHKVRLSVFDILGREVKVLVDQYQEKGVYEINFDASDLPSGIYFCRLQAYDTSVKKMIHLK